MQRKTNLHGTLFVFIQINNGVAKLEFYFQHGFGCNWNFHPQETKKSGKHFLIQTKFVGLALKTKKNYNNLFFHHKMHSRSTKRYRFEKKIGISEPIKNKYLRH